MATSLALAASACVRSTDGVGIERAEYVVGRVGDIQSVSPSADFLVVGNGELVCLQALDGSDLECLPHGLLMPQRLLADLNGSPDFAFRRRAGGWAADGSLVAFHDLVATDTAFDSTVWVLDTREPALRTFVSDPDFYAFDVAISPGAGQLTVAGLADQAFGVFLVPAPSELELLAELPARVIEWLPDGSGILFTGLHSEPAGIWEVGKEAVKLVAPADEARGQPDLVAVSSDAEWALVYYQQVAAAESPENRSHFGLVRIETGEITPLKDRGQRDFLGPRLATFSPDGRWIAYTYHDGRDVDSNLVLAIRPTDGSEERIVSPNLYEVVGDPPTPQRFPFDQDLKAVWAPGDRLVFPSRGWVLVVDLK